MADALQPMYDDGYVDGYQDGRAEAVDHLRYVNGYRNGYGDARDRGEYRRPDNTDDEFFFGYKRGYADAIEDSGWDGRAA